MKSVAVMCDQWNNSTLLDLNPHILSCLKCLYRKLEQHREEIEKNKEACNEIRKTREAIQPELGMLVPGHECLKMMQTIV